MLSACVWHLIKIWREILQEKINNIYLLVINEDCSLLTDVHIAAALCPGQHVDAADVADAELCEAAHQPRVEGGGVSDAVGHSAWKINY